MFAVSMKLMPADVERRVEAGSCLLRLDSDAVGQPGAQSEFGHFDLAVAKPAVFHAVLSFSPAPDGADSRLAWPIEAMRRA